MKKHFILLLSFCLLFPASLFSDPVEMITIPKSDLIELLNILNGLEPEYDLLENIFQTQSMTKTELNNLIMSYRIQLLSLSEQLRTIQENSKESLQSLTVELNQAQSLLNEREKKLTEYEQLLKDYSNQQRGKIIKASIITGVVCLGIGFVIGELVDIGN